MSTRSPEIITRANEVDSDLVPEPWDARDNASDRSLVAERERYRLEGVTDSGGAGIVPAYALDVAGTGSIPSKTQDGWTRGSAGRVLGPDGKYVSKASDTPRLSFDGEEPGLLVEAASRTNYVVDSSDLSQWVEGSNVSLGSAVTSIIDGETAYKASQSGFSLFDPAQSKTLSASTETAHAFIETDTAGEFAIGVANETAGNRIGRVIYDLSSGTVTTDQNNEGTIEQANARIVTPNAPNGGKLIHLIFSFSTPNDGDTARFEYYPDTTNSGDTSIFHHGQWEEAPNASSPIVTGGSPTTRSADDYKIFEGGQPDWWNDQEMTVYVEATLPFFNLGDATNRSNHIKAVAGYIMRNGNNKKFQAFDGNNVIVTPTTSPVFPFTLSKYALSLTRTDAIASLNGHSNTNSHNGNLLDTTTLDLNGDQSLFHRIIWFPRALPELTLNRITS